MQHTPEPWGWQFFGPHLALVGMHSDRPIVLDVTPRGVVRLNAGGVMRPITMVAECDQHPDFRLIKAAPNAYAIIRAEYDAHNGFETLPLGYPPARAKAIVEYIARVEGGVA